MDWRWCRLDDLTVREVYSIFAAREAVFIVEQCCPYPELDGLDFRAHHLVASDGETIAAYLRVVEPGAKFAEPSIGRVFTTLAFRRKGLGKELMQRALDHMAIAYLGQAIKISAQIYVDAFYRDFGFLPCSEPYLEDGILHVEMIKSPKL